MVQHLIIFIQKLKCSVLYKEGFAFALILVFFLVDGLISILLLFNISNTENIYRANSIRLEQLGRYELAYKSELDARSDIIFITQAQFIRDNFQDAIFKGVLQQAQSGTNNVTESFESKFSSLYNIAINHFSELDGFIRSGSFVQARTVWLRYTPDFEKVTAVLSEHRLQLATAQTAGENELNHTIALSTELIIGLTLFSILLALFLLFLIERVLVRPLNILQQGLKRVAAGDLGQQIEIYNRDEVGDLAFSFKMAVVSLQQMVRGVQISESLRAVSTQLNIVSKQQEIGSTEQVSTLNEVMASVHELGRTAGQIAENSVHVAGLTNITLEQIRLVTEVGIGNQNCTYEMKNVIENTTNGIERVGKQVEEFSHQMEELNSQAEAIDKVVSLLGSVAKEVHLLALNASIEAAGAGEFGERFKIVARQIKQLASNANQATNEARTLINGVQVSSRMALTQVMHGKAEVIKVIAFNSNSRQSLAELEQNTQQLNDAVVQLLDLVGQVSNQSNEIKQATHEQRISSEQVLNSVLVVETIARQTAEASHEIMISIGQLEGMSVQLNGVLSQVRLTH